MGLLLLIAAKPVPVPTTQLTRMALEASKKFKGYWIEVQIPNRKLILAKGKEIVKVFPVAVGMPSYPTPEGVRYVNRVVWNPWWYPPKTSDWVEDPRPVPPRSFDNPLGEIKIPLGEGYLIHGTSAVRSIGTWASHGCIRMMFEDIFGLVQLLLSHYSKTSAIESMERADLKPDQEFTDGLNQEIPVVLSYETVRVDQNFVTIAPDVYNQEPDRVLVIADTISSALGDSRALIPSDKKIKQILNRFRGRTIHVPIESLTVPNK